jgi:hypothetical protein
MKMETMPNDKKQILEMLREEYDRWEDLLAGLSEAQITARQLPSGLSVKDVIAHLWAWQTRSVARTEAARQNREPVLPGWPENLDPNSEDDLEPINAWIHETNRDKSWAGVYQDWRDGFRRFLESGEKIPEKDLLEPGKFPWLGGYPLAFILFSSYNHHHEEHLEPLLDWLRQNSIIP